MPPKAAAAAAATPTKKPALPKASAASAIAAAAARPPVIPEKRQAPAPAAEDEPDTKKQYASSNGHVSGENVTATADSVHQSATTHDAAGASSSSSSTEAVPSASNGTSVVVDKSKIQAKERTAISVRKVSHLMNVVTKRYPDAILPPCLWPLVAKVALEKLRLKPNYFANIKVNSFTNKKFPGHIDFQVTESKMVQGKTDIGMRMINRNLKMGDEGFDAHFLMVSAPLMLLSHTTGPLGTFRDPNENITQHVKNRAYPDQHKHMWSFKSTSYTAPDSFKHAMIDAECYAFERWLIALQCSFFMAVVEAEELKRSCKPKLGAPKDRRWYEATVFKLGSIFRIMKFTKFIAEQKKGGKTEADKAVKDVGRKIDDGIAEIDIADLFGCGSENRPLPADPTKPDAAAASNGKAAAAGPVASIDYSAERFTGETGIELTKEELEEYARLQKINEDCLTVLVNKIYVALVSGLPNYDRNKDEVRDNLNLGTTFNKRTVPIKQFAHEDAPLAPESMWPIVADSIEPYIAEGHLSATSNVFEYQKERVPSELWNPTKERLYKNSKATQQIPVLDHLFKARGIILKELPVYAGFSNTPLDVTHRYFCAGDVVQPNFYIRCTLDAPVDVGMEKIIFFNQKLDLAAARQMFRPTAARKASMLRSNYTPAGKLDISESDFAANPESTTTAMTIVDESDVVANRSLSSDEMELLQLLKTPDDQLKFPTFHEANHALLSEATPIYKFDAIGAANFVKELAVDAQKQIVAKAAESGNHLEAGLRPVPRQMTAAVRKQLAAPTAAPDFGEGDEDMYEEDAGAEYVDNPE